MVEEESGCVGQAVEHLGTLVTNSIYPTNVDWVQNREGGARLTESPARLT